MKAKAVSGIMLTLLLIGMLTFAFNTQTIGAQGTIYIRPDGTVDPSQAPIASVDNVTYTFTDSIYDSIVVGRDNIVVDGAGYTLQGIGGGIGINLSDRSNVTIKNMEIIGFDFGIALVYSSNNSISGNNITNNEYGIHLLEQSSSNTISGNNITKNERGIILEHSSSNNSISGNIITNNWRAGAWLLSSNYNSFSGNNITNNGHGIKLLGCSTNSFSGNQIGNNEHGLGLSSSSGNVFKNNNMVSNSHNFGVAGVYLSHFIQDLDLSNTIDEKPIYYFIEENNLTITPFTYPNIGYLALISSTNITIEGLEQKNNGEGILLANTTNSRIISNNITNNKYGIYLFASSHNSISGNNITKNYAYGIHLQDSSNNTVLGNKIIRNGNGVLLFANYASCNNNSVFGNDMTYNGYRYGGYGLGLTGSSSNIISGNNITNSDYGFRLWGSSSNIICGNNVTNNGYGVDLWGRSSDNVYHNNFVDNTHQVRSHAPSTNVWDDGYPSGGNYWSDYENKYPDAEEIDVSGIWNTAYFIDEGNQDNYPLMYPWGAFPPPDTAPPTISIVSPENKTYPVEDVPLTFTLNESTSWIGYSLDGEANETITGNTTLSGMFDGVHSLIVYAKDKAGNAGASQMVYFTIETQQPEPFPIWTIGAVVVVVGTAIASIFIWRRRQ